MRRASSIVAGDLSSRLYAATTEAERICFNLINPRTNNRIRMQTVDAGAGAGEEVPRGFSLEDGFFGLAS